MIAFCVAAFVVLVVVRAIQIGSDGARSDADTAGSSTTGTASPPLAGEYREPSGCFAFDPGTQWELIEETSLRALFSADPDNPLSHEPGPGDPGLWVEASCAPLRQVGTYWTPSIPGFTVLESERVDFGGDRGRLRVMRMESRDHPAIVEIGYWVDRHGARCGLTVEGSPEGVERFRPAFERAASSFVCAGR